MRRHKPLVKKSRLEDGEWVWFCTGCSAWRSRPDWWSAYVSAMVHHHWANGLVK